MPNFHNWIAESIPFNLLDSNVPKEDIEIDPPMNVNHEFIKEIIEKNCFSRMTFEKWERAHRSHG